MLVNKALGGGNTAQPPSSKIPVPAKTLPPSTGVATAQAGKDKVSTHEDDALQTEQEKLETVRYELEQSLEAFIIARKEIKEILAAEGSSEQELLHHEPAADLATELRRHRELTSRAEASLKGSAHLGTHSQGAAKKASSYDFLRSIIG